MLQCCHCYLLDRDGRPFWAYIFVPSTQSTIKVHIDHWVALQPPMATMYFSAALCFRG